MRLSAEPISTANTTAATGVPAGRSGTAAVTTAGGVAGGACAPVAWRRGWHDCGSGRRRRRRPRRARCAAGGALLAGVGGTQLLGAPQLGPALEGMVRASTPIAEASSSEADRLRVLPARLPAMPRSRSRACAPSRRRRAKGVNWVMLDTNSPAVYRAYVRKYGVADLPHFTFFAADGHVMGAESGLTADVGLRRASPGSRGRALLPSG